MRTNTIGPDETILNLAIEGPFSEGIMSDVSLLPAAAFLCFATLPFQARLEPEVTAEQVVAALPELEKLVKQTLKKTGVPGMAIVIVHKDKVVFLKGFGVRRAGQAAPVNEDTVFLLASLSKPITSTLLALLVGEELIAWDDLVIDLDPGFRLFDPYVTRQVTLRDLLCHRSGLPEHAGDLLEDLGFGRADVLERLRHVKPASSFRSEFAYTNFGYTAAAVAAARKARKSWEALIADKLYRPLGMKSTSSRNADYAAAMNRAHLHVKVDGKWVAKYERDADAQSPAGGVNSTARDLAQWMRLQLGRGKFNATQIVAAKALAETHRPQIISRPPANPATDRAGFYGLGWNVNYDDKGRVRLGHSGGFDMGAATVVNLVPSEDLGIAVLTNAAPMGVPEAIAASFLDLVLNGKMDKDWVGIYKQAFEEAFQPNYGTKVNYLKPGAQKSPALPAAAYLGTYGNPLFGEIEVMEKEGSLLLRMGPKKMEFPLRHWDRDVFIYQPVGEMAGGLSGVTFTVRADHRAVTVVVENLDVYGQGMFARTAPKK
jgi:CubicO group peptidase (beta-lactamase class C family)